MGTSRMEYGVCVYNGSAPRRVKSSPTKPETHTGPDDWAPGGGEIGGWAVMSARKGAASPPPSVVM